MTEACCDHDLIYPNEESTLLGPPRNIGRQHEVYSKMAAFLIFLFPALGGLLFGYDTGVINGAQFYLSKYFELDAAMKGWVVGSALLGCFVGLNADFFSVFVNVSAII